MALQLALVAQGSHDRDLARLRIRGLSLHVEVFVQSVPIFRYTCRNNVPWRLSSTDTY